MSLKTSLFIKAISKEQLKSVPGVLGKICLERYYDYENKSLERKNDNFPEKLSFYEALAHKGLSVIAEIKGSSPSQGKIANLDPVQAATDYYLGGAAAISVLTEERHFAGKLEYISMIKSKLNLPLLRKDFTVHPAQILEAAQNGASAILIIVAVTQKYTAEYIAFAESLGLDALVEVHDEQELAIALNSQAKIIGVNNRNLQDLSIDLNNAPNLIQIAKEKGFKGLLVAESGYKTSSELLAIRDIADAVLIGTSLAASGNLRKALEEIRGDLC